MEITPFFDTGTSTWSYVVAAGNRHAVVIDPVLDFDPATGVLSTAGADRIIDHVKRLDLNIDYLLETHVHADHLSASQYLKAHVGGDVAIGRHVDQVQEIFGPRFNTGADFKTDGRQFDKLLSEGDTFRVGDLEFSVLHTPGHTPGCITYVVDSSAFVGDTLFMPDYGTARTDFPGGDAAALFDSINKILALPEDTELFMCHDYLPEGRSDYQCRTTVKAQRDGNVQLVGRTRDEFVAERRAKDRTLAAPRLLMPSIQVNMRAGHLPPAETNHTHYLKIPLQLPWGATWV